MISLWYIWFPWKRLCTCICTLRLWRLCVCFCRLISAHSRRRSGTHQRRLSCRWWLRHRLRTQHWRTLWRRHRRPLLRRSRHTRPHRWLRSQRWRRCCALRRSHGRCTMLRPYRLRWRRHRRALLRHTVLRRDTHISDTL